MPLTIPFSFGSAGLNTPTTQLDSNYSAIANWINPRNPASGNLSARPAAGNAGALFIAVDQNNQLYLDSGTAWLAVSAIQAPSPYATLAGQATPPATPVSPNLIVYVGTQAGADLTILDEQGVSRTIESVLFRAVNPGGALSTVSNITTAISIFPTKPVIKAHTLTPNRALRIHRWHYIWNNSGVAHVWQCLLQLGGVTFSWINTFQVGINWASTAAQQAVHTEYLLTNFGSGSGGQVQCFTRFDYSTGLITGTYAAIGQVLMQLVQNAINPEIDNTLDIQVGYDVALTTLQDTTVMVLGELL
jgi:hypothetical protein